MTKKKTSVRPPLTRHADDRRRRPRSARAASSAGVQDGCVSDSPATDRSLQPTRSYRAR